MAKVLVAESNTDLQRMIQSELAAAGHTVTVVPDAPTALAAAVVSGPDLCIVDVTPVQRGVDLCQALRGEPSTALSPIIFVTSMAHVLDIDEAIAVGADEYLVKPFSPENLRTHVGTLLEQATHPV